VVALTQESHRVDVFEPGAHTLEEQIRAFASCRGIIAIRGAELANIVWLSPTSKVIVINAGQFRLSQPPARGLARLLGISYAEIELGEECYPALDDALIERIRAHIEN
jgi:capsular polysaccharide biosynthesis protein